MKDIKKVVEYIKKNRADDYGNIHLENMDFGDANVRISGMKVGGVLWQDHQTVEGHLCQGQQRVQGDLFQCEQNVDGTLYQDRQKAKMMFLQDRDGFEQKKDGCWVKKPTISERLSASDEDKKVLSELIRSSEEGAKEAKRELPKKENKKYTLQECFDSNVAIHCDTEEKAKKLCKAMDKAGWKWRDGRKYTEDTRWWLRKKETCYHPTVVGGHEGIKWYKIRGIHVVEFEDVDLGEGEK